MFKKRKEKKAQAREAGRNEAEKKFLLALESADQIEDPAEKIMELMSLNEKISDHLAQQQKEISNGAVVAENKVGLSMSGTGVAASFASIPLTGPVGLAAAGVGIALSGGSIVVSRMRRKSVAKNLAKAASGHMEEMDALQERIDNLIDETIENNVSAISTSPKLEDMLMQPRISDVFATASAKYVAENANLVAEARKILEAGQAVKGAEVPAEKKEEPRLTKKSTPRLIKPN